MFKLNPTEILIEIQTFSQFIPSAQIVQFLISQLLHIYSSCLLYCNHTNNSSELNIVTM